jgi:hypothetical protein
MMVMMMMTMVMMLQESPLPLKSIVERLEMLEKRYEEAGSTPRGQGGVTIEALDDENKSLLEMCV